MHQPCQLLMFLCLPSLSCVRDVWDCRHQGGFLLQNQTFLQCLLLQKLLLKLQEGQHPRQTAGESKLSLVTWAWSRICLCAGLGGCSLVKDQTALTNGLFLLPEVPRECMPAESWCSLEAEGGHFDMLPAVSSCSCEH